MEFASAHLGHLSLPLSDAVAIPRVGRQVSPFFQVLSLSCFRTVKGILFLLNVILPKQILQKVHIGVME